MKKYFSKKKPEAIPGGCKVETTVSSEIVQLGSVKGTRNCEAKLKINQYRLGSHSIQNYSVSNLKKSTCDIIYQTQKVK